MALFVARMPVLVLLKYIRSTLKNLTIQWIADKLSVHEAEAVAKSSSTQQLIIVPTL